ncbi:MAG: hypothetical protein J6K96_07270 [Treponema sp.]|nr:hypothetical protein [Treponema sp.]
MNRNYRIEIISNQSVQDEITELLEQEIPDIEYTVIPTVHGRGRRAKKLGTTTWPEQNFVMFAYLGRENALKARVIIDAVKKRFPGEGISMFCSEEVEPQ